MNKQEPTDIAQEFINKLQHSHRGYGELLVELAEKMKSFKDFSDYQFEEVRTLLIDVESRLKNIEKTQDKSDYDELALIAKKDHEYLNGFRIMWKVVTGFLIASGATIGFILGSIIDLKNILS